MELLYVYIKEYNSLSACEINFGGKYRFHYNEEERKLHYFEDPDYIHNYFPPMISNVTAIVGENGSGKSTVIEFLLKHLTEGNSIYKPRAIVIEREWLSEELIIYIHEELFADFSHSIPLPVKWVHELRPNLTGSEIIYYTNSFYDRVDMHGINGLLNISFRSSFFNTTDREERITTRDARLQDGYNDFMFAEYWRILRFMQSGLEFDIDFRLPKYLILSNLSSKYTNVNSTVILFNKLRSEYSNDLLSDTLTNSFAQLSNYLFRHKGIENDPIGEFIFNLETSITFDYIFRNPSYLVDYLKSKFNPQQVPKRNEILKIVVGNNVDYNRIQHLLELTRRLLSTAAEKIDPEYAWINTELVEQVKLLDYVGAVKDLMHPYAKFISIQFGFEKGKINELSSGEMAILSLLARFFSLSRTEQFFVNLRVERQAIILIDEGELYLHPSWQKKLVNILVSNLPQILDDVRLQIILTSHSPFVLSDLPKSKVHFLIRKDRNTKGSEILEHSQTLAANIHTLLADAFFIDDGFTGNYAKRMIDNVIKDLNTTKQIDQDRREDIRRIIVAIGEPILKRKLNEMYHQKFNLDIDDRITRLEKNAGL